MQPSAICFPAGLPFVPVGLVRRVREVLSRPFQALPVIDLLGLVDRFSEGHRPAMLGDLLKPGSPAVGEHEVRFGNPQLLLFLLRFQDFDYGQPL